MLNKWDRRDDLVTRIDLERDDRFMAGLGWWALVALVVAVLAGAGLIIRIATVIHSTQGV